MSNPADVGYQSPLRVKGDIIARGAGADIAVAAGADGQFVGYDSTQPGGIRPMTAPSGSGGSKGVSAYPSATNQSIGSGAFVKLTLGTIEFDSDGGFASSRFTAKTAGYWQISANAVFLGSAASTEAMITIYRNGTLYRQGARATNAAAARTNSTISSCVYLNGSTDYVEIYVYTGSAGGVSIESASPGSSASTWFSAKL